MTDTVLTCNFKTLVFKTIFLLENAYEVSHLGLRGHLSFGCERDAVEIFLSNRQKENSDQVSEVN